MSSRVLKCFPNSSVIEEDGQGLLKSGSIAGTAVLEVTSIEPFGVSQTTITGVQVSPELNHGVYDIAQEWSVCLACKNSGSDPSPSKTLQVNK